MKHLTANISQYNEDRIKVILFKNRTIHILDGTSGTSSAFIALIIVSATFPSLLRNMMTVLNPNSRLFNGRHFWLTLFVDFIFIILPCELMITILNEQSPYFFAVTCLSIVLMFTTALSKRHIQSAMTTSPFLLLQMPDRSPFIHYFRAYTNIFTSFSILAVDFNIYPEYFMKSRVYGTALMDSGLGFYIISNAIVSPEARGVVSSDSYHKMSSRTALMDSGLGFYIISNAIVLPEARGVVSRGSVSKSLRKAGKDTLPLLFFGFARFYVLGMADYHVPVQEYGVHWNFFFTLAVVKMLSTLLFCITPRRLRGLLGPAIIVIYQCLLTGTGLMEFILFGFDGHASREGLVEANREGIMASIGFLAIYFIGVQIGTLLMKRREITREYIVAAVQVTCICCGSWIMMNITGIYIQRPSRKFANLSYAFFVIGVTTVVMIQGLVFDIVINYFRNLNMTSCPLTVMTKEVDKDVTCPLLRAINYNGLLFFAVANLLTGTINMVIDTKTYSNTAAFCIVSMYMLTLSFIFLKLYRRKFVFKSVLWRSDRKSNAHSLPS